MPDPAVSLSNVSKVYEPSPPLMRLLLRSSISEPVTALAGVTLNVAEGEVCAVVGPNGAGKSTMFRILTGLTTPTHGRASVLGIDATSDSHKVRRLVGFAPAEERTLMLRHTCRENLVFHGQMQGMGRHHLKRRIDETLELVGLAEAGDRVGFALSSGMKARLQLARALLHQPQVLILDEPTAAVDPVSAFGFLEIIQQIARDDGVAVLISSHRLEEIEALRDKIVLLNRGRIIFAGDLDSLRRLWERPLVEMVFTSQEAGRRAVLRIVKTDSAELVSDSGPAFRLSSEVGTGKLLAMLDDDLREVVSVQQTRIQLLELFAQVLGQDVPDDNSTGTP